LPEVDIICKRCGKKARITAENGLLCLACWRLTRQENRDIRQKESLDICFSYMNDKKVTEKEAKIISEVMEELNKNKPVIKKPIKKKLKKKSKKKK
jgi:hypothetical protein